MQGLEKVWLCLSPTLTADYKMDMLKINGLVSCFTSHSTAKVIWRHVEGLKSPTHDSYFTTMSEASGGKIEGWKNESSLPGYRSQKNTQVFH